MADQPVKLYRHFDANGALLYVGISLNAVSRLSQHKASPWYDEIASVKVETLNSRDEALEAEANAIRAESPKYNIQHRVTEATRHEEAGMPEFGNVRQPPRPIASNKGCAKRKKRVSVNPVVFDENTCNISLTKAKKIGYSGRRYTLNRDVQEYFGIRRDNPKVELREDIVEYPGLGDCLRLSLLSEQEPHSRASFYHRVFEKETKDGKRINKLDANGDPIETRSSKENPRFYVSFSAPDTIERSRPSKSTRYMKGQTEDGRKSVTFIDYTMTKEELGE